MKKIILISTVFCSVNERNNEHSCPKCTKGVVEVIDMYPSVCDYQNKLQKSVFESLNGLIKTLGDGHSTTFNDCANKLLTTIEELGTTHAEGIVDGLITAHGKLIELKHSHSKLRLARKQAAAIKRKSIQKSNVIMGRDLIIRNLQTKLKDLKRNQR